MRVLVFEDNDVNQRLVGRMLRRLGHETTFASDGASGLVHWEREPDFDFVFMDLELPDMSGYDAAQRIRAYERSREGAAIPIVALTAHAAGDVRGRCLGAGMNDCLGKPMRLGDLERVIKRWLARGA
ncbi:MAG: response regulator [Myxococcales bacterium]|nr:response regulator [Myxococcales bacterium]